MSFKSGFVAIVGKPNVGKSTLLNTILSRKVAIATPKPQTTRDNIRGILTTEDTQIIFIDTPGIHKPSRRLNELMVEQAYSAIKDVDLVLLLIDGQKGIEKSDEIIINTLKGLNKPVFLVINKIDKLTREELIRTLDDLDTEGFAEIVPVSSLGNRNVDELLRTIRGYLTDDTQYYPSDMISDYPETFLMSEIIREKVLLNTEEEVPHSVAVVIENIEHKKEVDVINALIVCERTSQKKIIIGKNGAMLKKIATFAREELEARLGRKVYLEVFVSVEENWRNRRFKLQQLGYGETKKE